MDATQQKYNAFGRSKILIFSHNLYLLDPRHGYASSLRSVTSAWGNIRKELKSMRPNVSTFLPECGTNTRVPGCHSNEWFHQLLWPGETKHVYEKMLRPRWAPGFPRHDRTENQGVGRMTASVSHSSRRCNPRLQRAKIRYTSHHTSPDFNGHGGFWPPPGADANNSER